MLSLISFFKQILDIEALVDVFISFPFFERTHTKQRLKIELNSNFNHNLLCKQVFKVTKCKAFDIKFTPYLRCASSLCEYVLITNCT